MEYSIWWPQQLKKAVSMQTYYLFSWLNGALIPKMLCVRAYLCSRFITLINLIDETVIIVNPSPIPKFIKTNVNKSIWNK
jgi:hypothetical protein